MTVEMIEAKIAKKEEELKVLRSQLAVLKDQRMIDLTSMPLGFKKVPDELVKEFSEHLRKRRK